MSDGGVIVFRSLRSAQRIAVRASAAYLVESGGETLVAEVGVGDRMMWEVEVEFDEALSLWRYALQAKQGCVFLAPGGVDPKGEG